MKNVEFAIETARFLNAFIIETAASLRQILTMLIDHD